MSVLLRLRLSKPSFSFASWLWVRLCQEWVLEGDCRAEESEGTCTFLFLLSASCGRWFQYLDFHPS